MTALQRARIYVRRNTKRTVLLFLLFGVLMTISLLAVALHMASSESVRELRERIGGYIMIQTGQDGKELTGDILLNHLKTLDNVKGWNGVDTYYMYAKGLKLVPGSYSGTGEAGEFSPKCIGCLDTSLHERFLTSSFQLTEGRHITPDDVHTVILSKDVAEQNDLTVGDTITLSVVDGVQGWLENAYGTQVDLKIVGIYVTTHNEPSSPSTPESELQENIFFTDSSTAKELFLIRFQNRTKEDYTYSSGIMLFLKDPSRMEETVSLIKQQPYADWDGLVVTPNDTAYQQAAGPILKAETISRFMLLTILAISIVILSLILLMWTRERMHEIGILISLGLSPGDICRQLLLENYLVALPAYLVSVLISALLAGQLLPIISGASVQVHLNAIHAILVLAISAEIIFLAVLIASASILRKKPREILIDLI